MALVLRSLEAAAETAWDAFVEAAPGGTFFHRAAWRHAIERALGHTAHYVLAEQDGAVAGVLPLVRVRTRLFGDTLISNPFCVYGGPLAANDATRAALEAHAAALLARCGASAVELRYREATDSALLPGPDLYVTFRKAIAGDDEQNMKAIPRKQRAMVRKGIANGLVSVLESRTETLHRVYAESVRNLGTPVFSRRWFRVLMELFAGQSDIVTVLDDGRPVASVMNFYFRDEVLPYYGGGTAAARGRAANDFMYWEVMRRAAARGSKLYDFGRSKRDTGAFAFKKNWGFVPEPLHYRFLLRPGAAIPEINPLNPKYRLFIAAWKRLPLPVANLLGPPIVRGIG